MLVKALLIVFMTGVNGRGAIDHIEFETMAQCLKAKNDIQAIQTPRNFISYSIYGECLEVVK